MRFPGVSLAPDQLIQSILEGWMFASTINITNMNSSAPDTEKAIISSESYGRQLGQILDVLVLLIKNNKQTLQLTDVMLQDENHPVGKLMALDEKINKIKENAKSEQLARIRRDAYYLRATDSSSLGKVMVEILKDLEKNDKKAYDEVRKHL